MRGKTCLPALLLVAMLALPTARAAAAGRLDFLRVQAMSPGAFAERVAQTPDGWLWVATRGGLVRHDGATFTPVSRGPQDGSPPPHGVRVVHVSQDGVLWVVRAAGDVERLEGGRFHQVPRAELPPGTVLDIAGDRQGGTWIVATGGVVRVREGQQLSFQRGAALPDGRVLSIRMAADGTPWLETTAGWARFDGQVFVAVAPPPQRSHFVLALAQPAGRAAPCEAAPAPYCGQLVDAVLHDRRARTWIASPGGLWVDDGQRTRRLTSADGLPDDEVRSLYEDREGGIWVTTHGGGLARIETDPIFALTTKSGLPGNTPFGLAEAADGAVWIGSIGGLTRAEGQALTNYRHRDAIPKHPHSLAFRRDGSLWMSTYDDLLMRFDAGQVATIRLRPEQPRRRVMAMREDDAGALWIGSSEGELFRAVGETPERVPFMEAACPSRRPTTTDDEPCASSASGFAARRAGGLWIATFTAGLHRWDGTSVRAEPLPPAAREGSMHSVHEDDDGTLWLGTNRGLVRVRDGRAVLLTWEDGRNDPSVQYVVDDGRGFLWLGTHGGVTRVARASLDATARDPRVPLEVVRFGSRDGLPSEVLMGAFDSPALRTRDGLLWFSTNTGVAVIDPARVAERGAFVPRVHLEGLAVDGAWTRYPYVPPVIDVAPGYRMLDLAFAAPLMSGAHRLRYRHQIVGLDSAPSAPSPSPHVQLAHVPPGSYLLKVQAMREDRPDLTTELTIPLRLRPLFRQTRAFQLMVGALVMGLVVGATVLRGRIARARMQAVISDRARIARDLHDSLAQIFAATRLRIGSLRAQAKGTAPAVTDGLGELERMLAHGREEARAVIWQLRSARRGPLSEALEELGAIYEGVRVNVIVTGTPYHLTLGAETEVLQIARQAVSNAVEHGGARLVGLDLEYGQERFALHVRDDGVGMPDEGPPARTLGHHGLAGMRERAARAGGRLSIDSTAGVGTEVSLIIEPPPRERA